MYTIVVADDEEELRRAIIRKVDWEAIGFQVVGEAENGIEALELVGEREPDLLLTDIRMPFISGLELARQVREVRPSTQIAFLSGYDDFSYAQEAIRYNIISYMLKPISMEELTENLRQIKEKLDILFTEFAERQKAQVTVSEFLLPLLMDSFQTDSSGKREERLREQAVACRLLGPESSNIRYVVMSFSLWDQAGRNLTEYNHLHAISSILKKYTKSTEFFLEDKITAVLAATPAAFDKYLHIISDEVIQSIGRILGLRCCIGAGRITPALTGLSEAYRDSVNALHYAEQSDGSGIRYISDEEPFSGADMDEAMKAAAGIEAHIRTGSREELEAELRKVFSNLREEGSREGANFLMVELFSGICRVFYSVSPEPASSLLRLDPYMQQMMFLDGSLLEAEEHFVSFCMGARDAIEEQKARSSMDICERALDYIEKNYAKADLSLMSVSTKVGASPNYLSSLIKKRTGRSFVDYLTARRMEEARSLLLGTGMKIREVSEACGYSDQHYFSYCFKKFEGVSPNMLRQQAEGNA